MGSYAVVQCIRCLMGQPFYSSAVDAGMLGERGYGDGSTLYTEKAMASHSSTLAWKIPWMEEPGRL